MAEGCSTAARSFLRKRRILGTCLEARRFLRACFRSAHISQAVFTALSNGSGSRPSSTRTCPARPRRSAAPRLSGTFERPPRTATLSQPAGTRQPLRRRRRPLRQTQDHPPHRSLRPHRDLERNVPQPRHLGPLERLRGLQFRGLSGAVGTGLCPRSHRCSPHGKAGRRPGRGWRKGSGGTQREEVPLGAEVSATLRKARCSARQRHTRFWSVLKTNRRS